MCWFLSVNVSCLQIWCELSLQTFDSSMPCVISCFSDVAGVCLVLLISRAVVCRIFLWCFLSLCVDLSCAISDWKNKKQKQMLITSVCSNVQAMEICGMIFRMSRRPTEATVFVAWVLVARRQGAVIKVVKLKEKRTVFVGEVRKRRIGLKKTVWMTKTRRRRKTEVLSVAVSVFAALESHLTLLSNYY